MTLRVQSWGARKEGISPVPVMFSKETPHVATAPSLELSNVTVHYGTTPALEQVTVTLNAGDQVAVVGPNGAGKSTLFNVIAGIVKPRRGTVRIYGSGPSRHICVGYVPQRNRIDTRFPVTVTDVVMMGRIGQDGLLRWPSRQRPEHRRLGAGAVGMPTIADRQIGELSGGQQQRVFLARSLAQEAELLLMDEPLTGLDSPAQESLFAVLQELRRQGITMLIATHDLNEAAERFPLMWLLNRRLIAQGTPEDVLTPENLALAYGSQIHVLRGTDGAVYLTDTCCSGGHTPVARVLGSAKSRYPVLTQSPENVLGQEELR